jgi:protein-histidine pros-kinase
VNNIAEDAGYLLSVATAMRSYTSDQIVPSVPNDEKNFHAITVPAFAAQSVFRLAEGETGYSYREPALNPTNPNDKPTPFEVELLTQFRSNPGLKELSGVRDNGKGSVYYIARPLRVQESCLACHDTPQRAPGAIVTQYGPYNGFGWKLNEVVAMQSLTVPAAKELRDTGEITILIAGGLLLVFLATYLVLTLWINSIVVRPLKGLANSADAASTSTDPNIALPTDGAEEIQALAASIERLRTSLRKALQTLTDTKHAK